VLRTPLDQGSITRNVGILPIYGPALISTKGLEWDVEDWETEMGGQVSSSNHIVADQISITTNREVLFTVERAVGR
jgi:thiamine pyrophosphokinase